MNSGSKKPTKESGLSLAASSDLPVSKPVLKSPQSATTETSPRISGRSEKIPLRATFRKRMPRNYHWETVLTLEPDHSPPILSDMGETHDDFMARVCGALSGLCRGSPRAIFTVEILPSL